MTGCPKTGTTLMYHLIGSGFDGIQLLKRPDRNREEVLIKEGASFVTKCPIVEAEDRRAADASVRIVCMVRHPYATLISKHIHASRKAKTRGCYHNMPGHILRGYQIASDLVLRDRAIVVRFEDLLVDPNRIQLELSVDWAMKPSHLFSEAHDHFDWEDPEALAMHGKRKMDLSRLRPWEHAHQEDLQHIRENFGPEMKAAAALFGYDPEPI